MLVFLLFQYFFQIVFRFFAKVLGTGLSLGVFKGLYTLVTLCKMIKNGS